MNLDSPAGEAMVEAGAAVLRGEHGSEIVAYFDFRDALSAALSATVECAVCGGSGSVFVPESTPPVFCSFCDGKGRRLAIKEMLDE